MDDQGFLSNSFVYLAAAVLIVPFAKRGGPGSVLGYLIAGVAIGPFALGLIVEPRDILHFSEFGVVMMLFLIGWSSSHDCYGAYADRSSDSAVCRLPPRPRSSLRLRLPLVNPGRQHWPWVWRSRCLRPQSPCRHLMSAI